MRVPSPRWSSTLLIVAMVASVVVVALAPPAAAAWTTPNFVRSIGGNGRPGVFAWGAQYNPVSHEVLVGDYLNNQVRRFGTDGSYLGEFWRSGAAGQPYSIAVDPNDGDIYVAEMKDNGTATIAKYDKQGNFLFTITPRSSSSSKYQVWLTVDDGGRLWALDSHYWNTSSTPPRVVRYVVDDASRTVTRWDQFTITPPGYAVPRMYGIDVSSDGVVWLSDAGNSVVHRYAYASAANTLTYVNSFGQQQLGRDNRGIVVNDATHRVYVVDAIRSQVDIFDSTTLAPVGVFGAEGNGPGEFAGGGRQVTLDGQGNVWVADYGNVRVQKFTPTGSFVLAAPDPARDAPLGYFAEPRDVDVDDVSGEVYVADSWNQRFQRFTDAGAFIDSYGQRGPHLPYGQNYPRGIGVDEDNGYVWVASERGHHYKVYTRPTSPNADPQFVSYVGDPEADDTATGHLRWPSDVEFWNDRAFVADRVSNKVKIFDSRTFAEVGAINRTNRGVAVDPATGALYVIQQPSGSSGAIYRYVQVGGQYTLDSAFGVGIRCSNSPCGYVGASGTGNAQFTNPRDGVIVDGVLYVSDEAQSRISAFDLSGNFLGRWGGIGSGAYQFSNPSGLAGDDDGRLYVADAGNDRISVFDTRVARATFEGTKPVAAISAPTSGSQVPAAEVSITGTATDNQRIAVIEVSVQDRITSKWWNGTAQVWQTAKAYNIASWTGSGTSTTWKWYFDGVDRGGRYRAEARARDASNNANATIPFVNFTVAGGGAGQDLDPPETTVTAPNAGQTLTAGAATATGTATDDTGVTAAQVALRDVSTGSWWNGTSWVATQTWLSANLAAPGAAATSWSFAWTAAAGSYSLSARASDGAGNVDASPTVVSFTVVPSGTPDTTPAASAVTTPTGGAVLPGGARTFSGTATDDRSVAGVDVGIRNPAGQWWNATTGTWQATFRWNTGTKGATLGSPGAVSTTWTYAFTLTTPGSWVITTRASDATGNLEPAPRPWVTFTVS